MRTPITKPMLAATVEDVDELPFPMIASPKLDGIRCLKIDGKVLSRSLKPIANKHIRKVLEHVLPEGADGEIMSGDTFQATTSAVMSHGGEPEFAFCMFDYVPEDLKEPYTKRVRRMHQTVMAACSPIVILPVKTVWDSEELLAYEAKCLARGYEGVILRDPEGPYKCGRSTLRQGWLLKLKRFVDSEAEVIGFVEQLRNENEATVNALGYTERSSKKAGKVPAGTLGKLKVRDLKTGVEFAIGTGKGLTADLRSRIWTYPEFFVGQIVKYKYQPIGVKVAPRLPIFLGFRDERDMS